MRISWPCIMHAPRPALRYRHQPGRVDRDEMSFGRLTLGGVGWRDSSGTVAITSGPWVEAVLQMRGHANDGADGRSRAPDLEVPF